MLFFLSYIWRRTTEIRHLSTFVFSSGHFLGCQNSNPIKRNDMVLVSFCENVAKSRNLLAKRKIANALKRYTKSCQFLAGHAKNRNKVIIDILIGNRESALRNCQRLDSIDKGWLPGYCFLIADDIPKLCEFLSGNLIYRGWWNFLLRKSIYTKKHKATQCILARPLAKINWMSFCAMYEHCRTDLLKSVHLLDPNDADYEKISVFSRQHNDQELYDLFAGQQTSMEDEPLLL